MGLNIPFFFLFCPLSQNLTVGNSLLGVSNMTQVSVFSSLSLSCNLFISFLLSLRQSVTRLGSLFLSLSHESFILPIYQGLPLSLFSLMSPFFFLSGNPKHTFSLSHAYFTYTLPSVFQAISNKTVAVESTPLSLTGGPLAKYDPKLGTTQPRKILKQKLTTMSTKQTRVSTKTEGIFCFQKRNISRGRMYMYIFTHKKKTRIYFLSKLP